MLASIDVHAGRHDQRAALRRGFTHWDVLAIMAGCRRHALASPYQRNSQSRGLTAEKSAVIARFFEYKPPLAPVTPNIALAGESVAGYATDFLRRRIPRGHTQCGQYERKCVGKRCRAGEPIAEHIGRNRYFVCMKEHPLESVTF
jgi:hypothetical protein